MLHLISLQFWNPDTFVWENAHSELLMKPLLKVDYISDSHNSIYMLRTLNIHLLPFARLELGQDTDRTA